MDQLQNIRFRRTRDFGEIIGDTFTFLRQNFKPLGKSILLIGGPVILLSALMGGLYMADILSLAQARRRSYTIGANGLGTEALFLFFFSIMASTIITAIVYEYVVLYIDRNGESVTVEDVWSAVKGDFLRVLLTIIGQSLIIGLVVILFFLPGILFGEVGMIMVGVILFIFPCIYIAVALSLMIMIRIRERVSFSESISRSFELIKGEWWRTAGILLVMFIIVFTVSGVLYLPQYALTIIASLHSVEGNGVDGGGVEAYRIPLIIAAMLPQLGAFVLYSFPALAISFQYFNLAEKKEGTGLLERIEEFGSSPDTTDSYHEDH